MRILRIGLLIGCCAGLAACTANAQKGPVATVTVPSVGKPPPPASAQAALSSEAFTRTPASAPAPTTGSLPVIPTRPCTPRA